MLLRSSRRLPRFGARIRNRDQTASSTGMMIPRTSERNANRTTCSFHFPPIPLPSYFASHPGACSPLRSLLACEVHMESIRSILLEPFSAAPQLTWVLREKKQEANKHPKSNHFQFLVYPLVQTTKQRWSGHQSSMLSSSIAVASTVKRTMMMTMLCLAHSAGLTVAVLPAQRAEPGHRSHPCRSSASDPRAHHPGRQVCEQRPASTGAEAE